MKPDFQAVISGLKHITTVAAVFDDRVKAEEFLKAVKERDFGLSINISTSVDGVDQCCHAGGIPRHSVGYSLGFERKTEHLPNSPCNDALHHGGHGMVAHSLAKKMIDWMEEGRRTPDEAVTYLARFCSCGVSNRARAKRILDDARVSTK